MSFKEHPDYSFEVERLNNTMQYIENVITAIENRKETTKEDIMDAYKSLDPSDSSLSYASIMINTSLLDQLEKNYRSYIRVRKKPYFARIDIRQSNEEQIERLYIGKASLFNEKMEPVIIDWRAPIASIYYEGRLGKITYTTIDGQLEAELFLKRQFAIKEGEIQNMMDIDITAKDEFLQASLTGNANDRLKEIASTIQAEQNAIIRSDVDKTLVVQGVAGSGKTTIALHRIAYLVYTYENKFDPDHFMIIAPNSLFLNYISEVLPELGVEKVKQLTFADFVFEIIEQKLKLISPEAQITLMLEKPSDPTIRGKQEQLMRVAAFKGSLLFKDIINNYLDDLERNFVPSVDFCLDTYTFLSTEEVRNIFMKECYYSAFHKRLPKIKKLLNSVLVEKTRRLINQIENVYHRKIQAAKWNEGDTDERRVKIGAWIDERDELIAKQKKASKNVVKQYMDLFPKTKLLAYYTELMTSPELLQKYSKGALDLELAVEICSYTEAILKQNHVEIEDLAPIALLHNQIYGLNEKIEVRCVVMDEAQDFSLLQFYTLRSILDTNRFTIMGDLAQGIHSYRSISSWNEVLEKVFNADKSTYLTLEQSYRTTIEIMETANKIICRFENDDIILAKPVLRHGEQPEIKSCLTREEVIAKSQQKILDLKEAGFHSIALIGKTMKECENIEKWIQKGMQLKFKRLSSKDQVFDQELVIVPAHMAKGLEFDAVILLNIEEQYNENDLEIKLLYVALTRALHHVSVYYRKDVEGILEWIK